jgi:hypothetical protein
MIKFFRKIRQQLLSQNRLGKYLLYAIGEILLVVIGILIALQINNWNEQRKKDILEHEYYCRLLEDVELDIEQIDQLIINTQDRISSANNAIRLLKKEKALKVEVSKDLGSSIAAIVTEFTPNNSAFEDLKSGANLNIIKDKDFIKRINNYFKNAEQYLSIIQVNGDIALDRFFSYKDLYASGWVHQQMQGGRFMQYMEKDVKELIEIDNNETLSEQMKFQLLNDALRYISSNARQIQLYSDIKVEATQLLEILITKCMSRSD